MFYIRKWGKSCSSSKHNGAFHYAELKWIHCVRSLLCMLYLKPSVVSNYPCIFVYPQSKRHESLQISVKSSVLLTAKFSCPCIVGLLANLCVDLEVPPVPPGSMSSVTWRTKPYITRAWKAAFSMGINSAWKVHVCLQSSGAMPAVSVLTHNSFTIAPIHKQILSVCTQAGISKRHCTALWVLSVSKGTGAQTPNSN